MAAPDRLYFTGRRRGRRVLATPTRSRCSIGFVLDQQVTVQKAFSSARSRLTQRLGTLDAEAIARSTRTLEAAFREKPALHRFPGVMATRVAGARARSSSEYGGDAARIWTERRRRRRPRSAARSRCPASAR